MTQSASPPQACVGCKLINDGPWWPMMTHKKKEGALSCRPVSIFTWQVAAQSLHGGLDCGVVDLSQLFDHRHHQHTACRREDHVSRAAQSLCWESGEGGGNVCVLKNTSSFQSRELLFAIHFDNLPGAEFTVTCSETWCVVRRGVGLGLERLVVSQLCHL